MKLGVWIVVATATLSSAAWAQQDLGRSQLRREDIRNFDDFTQLSLDSLVEKAAAAVCPQHLR